MTDWNDPTAFEMKALHEALLFAFPTPQAFKTLLMLELGRSFAQLAPMDVPYTHALTDILDEARGSGWLIDLVQAALKTKPRSPKLRLLERSAELARADLPAAVRLEDLVRQANGTQDLMPWLGRLEAVGQCTCRIEYPVNTARGTGWLVGRDLLLTNWHVIDAALPGGDWSAQDIVCRFDYAVTPQGPQPGSEQRLAAAWCVDASPPSPAERGTGAAAASADTLDFALLRLARAVGDDRAPSGATRRWIRLDAPLPVPKPRDIVFVVQHPQGLPVKLAVGDVSSVAADGLRLYHTANTQGGSSGAVVLDARLQPVALHHAGDLLYSAGGLGAPQANQAVPIGRIAARLQAAGHLS